MRRQNSLRASDADRDAAIDRLREATGEGRLEPHELEQRVDAALRARTYGELAQLLADLPGGRNVAARRARWTVPAAGLLVAAALAVALVALVVVLVVAAAAWWIAFVLFWVVCRSRRRLVPGPARRTAWRARHAHQRP